MLIQLSLSFSCNRLFSMKKTASLRFTASSRFLVWRRSILPATRTAATVARLIVRHVFVLVYPAKLVSEDIKYTAELEHTSYFRPC